MCKKFRNVFTPTTANFDIRAIVDISISFGHGEEAQITGTSKLQEISKDDGNMSIVAFPSYHLAHSFHHIRKINFGGFDRLKVMFEMQSPIINRQLVTTQQQPLPLLPCLERLWVEHMNTLSHVWKCNNWNKFFILHKHQPQSSFQNLTYIYLLYCKSIKYLFSPLMSKLLSNLKTIYIIFCDGIEEIVSNRYDEDEVLIISTTTLFPHLDRLDLNGLRNLKHIGGGVAKGKTNVIHDQFKLSQVGVVSWSLCQYSTQIYIAGCHALSSVIPSYAAAQMHKLQNLSIHNCASMVEVFEIKEINNYGCSSNLDQGNITMHHELTNLKTLYISTCHLLEYIFTFSTLKSLKKLEELSIEKCKAMKVIVSEENGDESSKVVLPRLKSIKLDDLPNLVGFFLGVNIDFEFPSLDDVEISDCPQMMVFTSGESKAPKLECIQTWLGIHNLACGLNFHQTVQTCAVLLYKGVLGPFITWSDCIADVMTNLKILFHPKSC
ncbi:hypothetical protein L1987_63317 [Smallanthus sonchifolius]|uniref:Uncharacterized protein n=1 Tax=Smallanthus sonchifolius TaxID=185202 RepID=A0ACB9CCW7_9ASTR|nr:hypothetical protein L1987_63317 [Smallanthus sonchifolius]